MYSRNVIDLCEEDEALIKTHLGEFALYEGESVPLDLPMLNEEVNNGDLDNAVYRLENVYKYLDIEYKETRRGEKFIQINYIPVTSPQSQNPEFVNVRYNNDEDIEMIKNRLDLPMLNEAYYEVIANLGDKKTKENLDSFEEVQDFMDKMVKRNAISVDVTKFGKDKEQTIKYNWAGDKWKKESKSNINESYDYDEVAQSEFGMDYDQLGSGEKEWVRDEIDNMSMNEDRKYNQEELLRLDLIARRKFDCDYKKCTDEQKGEILKDKVKVGVKESIEEKLKGIDGKACWKGYKLAGTKKKGGKTVDNCVPMEEAKQDIYDKFLDNPSSPKGRAKSLILKFTKEHGDDASSMAVDRFAKQNNLKPEEKYILKYITKNDIKISSQSGGPDFSAVSEAEFKGKKVSLGKPKRGGPKAYYVYVKDGDKVKKVTFGSGGLRAKIKNKEARNAFAARHNCKDKKDRTKAGYWSCNLPRYAPALGLGAKMNTFW
ncbi:hypothetical protein N9875_00540 [bacterium]|nr:hypothetical protein [bacterium]